ncbi:MAG: glycerophosphodiester phosphodiesterase family protein [Rhizomicrobium sp.]
MVWNIAHRGGAALLPENTLAAFKAARAQGCDGIELDVQLSRDGEVVVVHDFRLNPALCRDQDGQWIQGPPPLVKELTLAQLKRYDIGRAAPSSRYARAHPLVQWCDGERIPTLSEVIAAVAGDNFWLFVELKTTAIEPSVSGSAEALAEATLAVLRRHHYLERSILVGFDWRGLSYILTHAPEVRCWFTTVAGAVEAATLAHIRKAGADGWFAQYGDATAVHLEQARALGLKLGAWTVNEAADLARLAGLDALCTDRPDRLARLIAHPQGVTDLR